MQIPVYAGGGTQRIAKKLVGVQMCGNKIQKRSLAQKSSSESGAMFLEIASLLLIVAVVMMTGTASLLGPIQTLRDNSIANSGGVPCEYLIEHSDTEEC